MFRANPDLRAMQTARTDYEQAVHTAMSFLDAGLTTLSRHEKADHPSSRGWIGLIS